MNILLLAPHPFYQDRGTPIAVDLLVAALSDKGVNVDLLTYHEGADRTYNGPGRVRIHRIKNPPLCGGIRPGFSVKKLIADVYMHRMAMRLARSNRYDAVHAVEESVFMAKRIARKFGVPYVFDMDSSMPEQIAEKMRAARVMLPLMRSFERSAIRSAAAVTAVCDSLADIARRGGAKHVVLLRDVPLLQDNPDGRGFREETGIDGTALLYIGNLEAYQGIGLLLESFARLPEDSGAHLVVVGGIADHIAHYTRMAEELGIGGRVRFLGPRPLADMAALMREADILVSPRTTGSNTPMKIYSYLASGRAVLATDLFTHTQVLDRDTAMLAPPEPEAFAAAMKQLIADAGLRERLAAQAARAVEEKYSLAVFRRTVNELYDRLAERAGG